MRWDGKTLRRTYSISSASTSSQDRLLILFFQSQRTSVFLFLYRNSYGPDGVNINAHWGGTVIFPLGNTSDCHEICWRFTMDDNNIIDNILRCQFVTHLMNFTVLHTEYATDTVCVNYTHNNKWCILEIWGFCVYLFTYFIRVFFFLFLISLHCVTAISDWVSFNHGRSPWGHVGEIKTVLWSFSAKWWTNLEQNMDFESYMNNVMCNPAFSSWEALS